MDDLSSLSLIEVSARLAAGDLSPVELTQAMLARIEALEPSLHAYALVTPERAMEDARRAAAEIGAGRRRGPLHGVPIALKDLIDTAGIATAAGTMVMAGRVPDEDATVAARLREAGAVLLGKLQLAEGAFSEHHPALEAPRNPWNADRWTGVSSSGAGVAVAAGLCFGALGTDTGGSIRFPSAACGVTGLKPTWGRVSRHGVFPLAPSLDHVGPMARSAGDCAALLGAIAGPDPNDPTALRDPPPDYAAELGRPLAGVTIGVDRAFCLDAADPEVGAAFEAALAALASCGAALREIAMPPTAMLAQTWGPACGVEAALAHEALFDAGRDRYGAAMRMLIELGRSLPVVEYARMQEGRRSLAALLDAVFDDVMLVATPALALPVPTLAVAEAVGRDREGIAAMLKFTALWNFSGHPTLSLPCGFDKGRMPIGFQLAGGRLREDLLLRAGAAFQRATDWHKARPPA